MRILAADTTTANGSVALAEDGDVVGEIRLGRQETHSRTLLPAIEFLLRSLGLGPEDVEAWAVTNGPGSFTGLRVGISTIQGLALASARPCVAVSALDALALRVAGEASHIAAMIDAYRGEVYAGLYDAQGRPTFPPAAEAPKAFLARVPDGAAFTGDAAEIHRAAIEARCLGAVFPERSPFLAGTVARIAAARAARGETTSPDALRPLYLRDADVRKPSS